MKQHTFHNTHICEWQLQPRKSQLLPPTGERCHWTLAQSACSHAAGWAQWRLPWCCWAWPSLAGLAPGSHTAANGPESSAAAPHTWHGTWPLVVLQGYQEDPKSPAAWSCCGDVLLGLSEQKVALWTTMMRRRRLHFKEKHVWVLHTCHSLLESHNFGFLPKHVFLIYVLC